MKPIPFAAKAAPVVATVKAAGRNGGVLQKVAAGKMGHAKPPTTPVKSDRGSFKMKG